jgi:Tfp pilus assembly protein PilF
MKLGLLLLLSLALGACAMAPIAPRASLFEDGAFAPPSEPIDAKAIFALSPEMRQFLDTYIRPSVMGNGPRDGLVDALENAGKLKLEYDAEMTRNAAQSFAARSGNCLSLVIMTAAFAKALDLPLRYHDVLVEETWGRDGHTYFSIGHVNVTLFGHFGRNAGETVIDFLPPRDVRKQRSHLLGEQTVIAMYLNNRAVESLVRGRLDDAYWFAREAIAQEPWFMNAYNTLGAIYERRGMSRNAEKVFEYVLAQEPRNVNVMSNLVTALYDQGRVDEANSWAEIMKRRDPNPPFSFFNRGLEAMNAGDYVRARELFAKEVDRAGYYHEFHYWLARAYVGLGDDLQARKHLQIAMENSTTRKDHDIYAAKFAWLSARASR